MLTKPYNRQAEDFQVPAVVPKPITARFRRMEDLLLEMRHEQDVLLKRLSATQVQVDALLELWPITAHPNGLLKLRQRP
jgi:hypothetical protein